LQVEVLGDLTERAVTALAQLDDLGFELRVNERRGRGFFFPLRSMVDILPGGEPLISDVRQSGSSPGCGCAGFARPADRRSASI
jgi:hypothetical protein